MGLAGSVDVDLFEEKNNMKRINAILTAFLILSGLFASGCITGGGPEFSVVEQLEQDGSYGTLLGLLEAAGLVSALEGEGPLTIFAPTDAAFDALPEGKLALYGAHPEALAALLLYHVVDGSLSTADVSKESSLTSLQGESLPITTSGSVMVGGAAVGESTECTNGAVIPVDAVLVPPSVQEQYIDFSFTDGADRDVYVEQVPQRIVSLASSATEVLFAIGAGDLVVGVDKYSTYPEEALERPNLGSGSALDMESLLALEPDMVVIWYFYDEAIQNIEAQGITVMAINPTSVQGIYDLMELLGTITGTGDTAASVVAEMQDTIAGITSYVETLPIEQRQKVYYETSKPFKTLNNNTFSAEIIALAGGYNIAGDQETQYPILASEWIIDQNPDVIVVLSYGASVEEIKSREGWGEIAAVQNDRVYAIESNWMTSNPRLVLGLEQLAKWFYPEQFQ
jgi:iron complex transport system substrate-binding protein